MKFQKPMTSPDEHNHAAPVLYMAFELSSKKWVLAFSQGGRLSGQTVAAQDFAGLHQAVLAAKRRWQLPAECPVRSCYEAGRDAFWLHRRLVREGIENIVVDSSSIEVPRRRRRVKTDRLDAQSLVRLLIRYHGGERKVWRVCRVPTVEQEDARRLPRERDRLVKERTQHRNRLRCLLTTQGICLSPGPKFLTLLASARSGDGRPVPPALQEELVREYERLQLVEAQVQKITRQIRQVFRRPLTKAQQMMRQLFTLYGIGRESAYLLVQEFFGWRRFNNGKEVGSAAGLTGTPYLTGGRGPDQGISKAGNRRVRALMIELAWSWLRYQPGSQLSQWFATRFAQGGKRARRRGIVAVARRLLIACWRYLSFGELPAGAQLKEAY